MDGKHPQHKSGERIAKVIARAGLGSRREIEAWIAAARVAVNGEVIASPALNVGAHDRITVDGTPLPERERTRLFMYHKLRGLVSTRTDPQGRPTVFDRLPKHLPRLISIGRLDFNTEGLLLLTNDGGLARVLELPATGWLRRYRVRAHGAVTQAALDALRGGVTIEGIRYGAIEATLDRGQGSNVWLTFAIREGKNREVRNVLGHLGLAVTRLIRVSFGPFQLGELAEGAVDEVKTKVLREQLGERIVAQSGADFSAPVATREDRPTQQAPQQDTPQRQTPRQVTREVARQGERPERARQEPQAAAPRTTPAQIQVTSWGNASADRNERGSHRQRPPRRPSSGPAAGALNSQLPQRDEKREKTPHRKPAAHAWRERPAVGPREKPLLRKFRGARRAAKEQSDDSAADKRAGLLTDRKGRRVLVERIASTRAEPPPEPPRRGDRPPPRGRRGRADRGSGPRPGPRRPSRPVRD